MLNLDFASYKKKLDNLNPILTFSSRPQGAKDWELKLLDQILSHMIPFNLPHGFKLKMLKAGHVKARAPYKRKNHNHLKGIHAACIVTLGEYCAGLSMLTKIDKNKYRFILKDLKAQYHYQGRTDLIGECEIEQQQLKQLLENLTVSGKEEFQLTTEIYDVKNSHVASVQTTWQLKSWEKVKTK